MLSDCCPVCPVCDAGALRPNGCMDQHETWRACRPRPWPHCVRWGPSSPSPKGAEPPIPPIFGPYLLWPNGCMDQDAIWYGGRPRPRRHCVRWGPRDPSQKGGDRQFPAHIYCGQTAAWIKMPLGTEVGLGLHNIVLDVDPAPPLLKECSPQFSSKSIMAKWLDGLPATPQKKGHTHPHPILAHVYCGQTAGWMKMPLGTEVDLGPGHILLDGVPAPRKKGHSSPHVFGPCLLWPRSPISATAELLFSDIFSDLRCWFGVKKSIWPVKN